MPGTRGPYSVGGTAGSAHRSDAATVWGRVIDMPGGDSEPPLQAGGLQLYRGEAGSAGVGADWAVGAAPSPSASAFRAPETTGYDPAEPSGRLEARDGDAARETGFPGPAAASSKRRPSRPLAGAPLQWEYTQQWAGGDSFPRAGRGGDGGSSRNAGVSDRLRTRRTDGPVRRRRPAEGVREAPLLPWEGVGAQEYVDAASRLWANVWPVGGDAEQSPAAQWDWDLQGTAPGEARQPGARRGASPGAESPRQPPQEAAPVGGQPGQATAAAAGYGSARSRRRSRAGAGASDAGASADGDGASWAGALTQWDKSAAGVEDSVSGSLRRYWEAVFVPRQGGEQPGRRAGDPLWLKAVLRTFPFLKAWGGFA